MWSCQPNAIVSGTDDFAPYFTFAEIPLGFDPHSHQPSHQHSHQPHGSGNCSDPHNYPNAMQTEYSGAPELETSSRMSGSVNDQLDAVLSSVEIMNMGFQQVQAQMQEQQRQLHQYHMNKAIPPTPSSLELQSGDMTPQMYNNFYTMKDEAIFTPLISPAVTPLDTHFSHLPDFSVNGGSYFSPLTSPMLEAQRQGSFNYLSASASQANTRKATSPTESSETPIVSRKLVSTVGRRKSLVGNRNASRVVRESPSMKPQRKKTSSMLLQAPEHAQNLVQQVQLTLPVQETPNDTTMRELVEMDSRRSSSSDSISPEPIPEALMPPPRAPLPPPLPAPKKTKRKASPKAQESMGPPPILPAATPMTPMILMRLSKSSIPTDTQQMPSAQASLLMLDDAHPIVEKNDTTSRRGSLATLDEDAQTTPTMQAGSYTPTRTPRETPLLQPSAKSSTTSLRASRNTSPVLTQPLSSAKIAPANITPRLTPKLQPQPVSSSSRKRSIPASPALAPKISPNIKPLLSNASLRLDSVSSLHNAASLLLASKSNYQNIVEGNTTSLGLSYPEELSNGLTSKRTNHKIAEQGRRNRINMALQEMASLLPSPDILNEDKIDGADEESHNKGGKSGGGSQNTSKAVTVERAIEYIRTLKKELADTQNKLANAEGKLSEKDGEPKGVDRETNDSAGKGDERKEETIAPNPTPHGAQTGCDTMMVDEDGR